MGTVSGARVAVAVAGAGALGLATALALARAGCAVTVFDPASPGDNASGVAAGMLAPGAEALFDPASSTHLPLLRRALALWPPFVVGLDLSMIRDDLRMRGPGDWLAGLETKARALGLDLAMGEDGDLLLTGDWRLEARPALASIRAAAQRLGARFEPLAVVDFADGRLTLADGAHRSFDHLVLATGAGERTGRLAPELEHLSPIKGQMLRLTGGAPKGDVLRGPGVYLCPGPSPAVGATMEFGRDDLVADPALTSPLLDAARVLWAHLSGVDAAIHVGVRAETPDGLPMVGASARPGIWLAVGARRNGWLLAPLVAGLVASYLTVKDPGPDAARLDARRFEREPVA